MLQNVIDITNACHALIQEGHTITEDDLSHMSSYLTEHLKRFGEYVLDLDNYPEKLSMIKDKFIFKVPNELLELSA